MTIHQRPQHDFGIGQQVRKSWKTENKTSVLTKMISLDYLWISLDYLWISLDYLWIIYEIREKSQDGHHPSLLTLISPK